MYPDYACGSDNDTTYWRIGTSDTTDNGDMRWDDDEPERPPCEPLPWAPMRPRWHLRIRCNRPARKPAYGRA